MKLRKLRKQIHWQYFVLCNSDIYFLRLYNSNYQNINSIIVRVSRNKTSSSLNRFLFTIAVFFFCFLMFVKKALSLLPVDYSGLSSASLRIKDLLISWLESSIWPDRSGRSTTKLHSSFEYDGWWKPGSGISQQDASPPSGSSNKI